MSPKKEVILTKITSFFLTIFDQVIKWNIKLALDEHEC